MKQTNDFKNTVGDLKTSTLGNRLSFALRQFNISNAIEESKLYKRYLLSDETFTLLNNLPHKKDLYIKIGDTFEFVGGTAKLLSVTTNGTIEIEFNYIEEDIYYDDIPRLIQSFNITEISSIAPVISNYLIINSIKYIYEHEIWKEYILNCSSNLLYTLDKIEKKYSVLTIDPIISSLPQFHELLRGINNGEYDFIWKLSTIKTVKFLYNYASKFIDKYTD